MPSIEASPKHDSTTIEERLKVLEEQNRDILRVLQANRLTNHPKHEYTTDEFGKAIGKHRETVLRWLQTKRLAGVEVILPAGYKVWRIPHAEIVRCRECGLRQTESLRQETRSPSIIE